MYDYSPYFTYSSILVIVSLMFGYGIKRHRRNDFQNNLYFVMLITIFCMSILRIFTIKFDGKAPAAVFVMMTCLFLSHIILIAEFLIFLLTFSQYRVHLIELIYWLALPLSSTLVLILGNIFSHGIYYINKEGLFTYGPRYYTLFLSYSFFVIGFALTFTRIDFRSLNKKKFVLPAVLFIGLIGTAVDNMLQQYAVQQFTYSVCMILLGFALKDPSEYYSSDSVFMNRQAFYSLYGSKLSDKQPRYFIAAVIKNMELLEYSLGKEQIFNDEKIFDQRMNKYKNDFLVFNLGKGKYIGVIDRYAPVKADQIFETLTKALNNLVASRQYDIKVSSVSAFFKSPDDVNGIRMLWVLFDKLSKTDVPETTSNRIINIDELKLEKEAFIFGIENSVMNAIEENRLEVYFQPIYNVHTKKYNSAEALLRMRDFNGNFISPDIFIPIAERSSLIIDIGDFVLDTVCRMIDEEHIGDYGIEYIEVNLSMIECIQQNLVARIKSKLNTYRIFPPQINMEVTETAATAADSTFEANMATLSRYGIRFSLDDFGTGFSSLMRILSLPLSIIKLDKTVVQPPFSGKGGSWKSEQLLKSLINTAKATDAKILAEGVETKEMAQGVIAAGCDYIQGYYFSKPVLKNEFINLVKENNPAEV